MGAVRKVYEDALSTLTDYNSVAFLTMHYARFQLLVCRDLDMTRRLYETALKSITDNQALWLSAITFESNQPGEVID